MDDALNYLDNLAFARSIDPSNTAFDRLEIVLKESAMVTGLTTIGDEKEWNVFMRLDSEPIRAAIHAQDGSRSSVLQALRDMKNHFKE